MNSVSWEATEMPITLFMEWIVVFIGICGFSGTSKFLFRDLTSKFGQILYVDK